MSTGDKEQLLLTPTENADPEIGRWLAAYEDARQRTLRQIRKADPARVDDLTPDQASLGAILYHLAAIEASWLYEEVLEGVWPDDFDTLFPHEVRADGVHLTHVSGESIDEHLGRLEKIHQALLEAYQAMTLAEFRRPRSLPEYNVTPEYVLHHLMQHEGEHRSQIGRVIERLEQE